MIVGGSDDPATHPGQPSPVPGSSPRARLNAVGAGPRGRARLSYVGTGRNRARQGAGTRAPQNATRALSMPPPPAVSRHPNPRKRKTPGHATCNTDSTQLTSTT
jgi:hypothetical protein